MKKRFDIHPFFLVGLVQKLRHGERDEAAALVANELMIAAAELCDDVSSVGTAGGSGDGSDGGLMMLPTLKRQQELGYHFSKVTLETNDGGNEDYVHKLGI